MAQDPLPIPVFTRPGGREIAINPAMVRAVEPLPNGGSNIIFDQNQSVYVTSDLYVTIQALWHGAAALVPTTI